MSISVKGVPAWTTASFSPSCRPHDLPVAEHRAFEHQVFEDAQLAGGEISQHVGQFGGRHIRQKPQLP